MYLFHHYHQHRIGKIIHSKFWLFEASLWIHVFARSLIAIFIPILLLLADYSIGAVMVYYVILWGINLPLSLMTQPLIKKIGAKTVMILSTIAIIAYFILFLYLTPDNWPIIVALAALAAIYDALFWVAHIYLFIKSDSQTTRSAENISILYIVKQIAGLLGPAIGALILIVFNQKILILVSILFFALSLIPLFKIKALQDKPSRKQLTFKEFFHNSIEKKNFISMFFWSLHSATESILWPLFIFMIFKSIEAVAYVPIVVSITAMIFSYFIGKITKGHKEKLIILGSILLGSMWILRILIHNPIFYYASIFLVGLFALLVNIPLTSDIFVRAQKKGALSSSAYRNASGAAIRLPLFIALAVMVNVFNVSFIIAAVSMFGLVTINYIFLLWDRKSI